MNLVANLPIMMVRQDLDDIPPYPLPASYSFRGYKPGDEALWRQIQTAADRYNEITPELFEREFGTDPVRLAERQLYLCEGEGQPVGTSTAWVDEHFQDPTYGRIHWVAILPAWQGQGLAKPLLSLTCQRLKALGHQRVYLTTESARIPALNLYLKFGFKPFITSSPEEQLWRDLAEQLKEPIEPMIYRG
jgi:GNAT superfamily N-acetyltransferase